MFLSSSPWRRVSRPLGRSPTGRPPSGPRFEVASCEALFVRETPGPRTHTGPPKDSPQHGTVTCWPSWCVTVTARPQPGRSGRAPQFGR